MNPVNFRAKKTFAIYMNLVAFLLEIFNDSFVYVKIKVNSISFPHGVQPSITQVWTCGLKLCEREPKVELLLKLP